MFRARGRLSCSFAAQAWSVHWYGSKLCVCYLSFSTLFVFVTRFSSAPVSRCCLGGRLEALQRLAAVPVGLDIGVLVTLLLEQYQLTVGGYAETLEQYLVLFVALQHV